MNVRQAVAQLEKQDVTTAPCINPHCTREVTYRTVGPGRQPYFCSATCRTAVSRERAALSKRWEDLEQLMRQASEPEIRARIQLLQNQTSWQMERYGQRLFDQPTKPRLSKDAAEAMDWTMVSFIGYLVHTGQWDHAVSIAQTYQDRTQP